MTLLLEQPRRSAAVVLERTPSADTLVGPTGAATAVPEPAAKAREPEPHPTPPLAKPARDNRLDFWRGLCLIDMLLVHLIHQGMSLGTQLDLTIGEYTRFAAGGFVFIAGMSIGRIFLPRVADPDKRWTTYRALWARAGVILAVHYVSEIGYLAMYPLFATQAVPNLKGQIWAILTMRAGYDLLPFYVIVVALAPGMLELLRRKLGWVLAAVSLGLFTYGQWGNPWAVAFPNQQAFLPILWQALFVAGLLGGAALPWYDRLSFGAKLGLAVAMVASHLVLFVACYGPDFGTYLWLPMAFAKVPLTTGETLRYLTITLAILLVTDLLWRRGTDGAGLDGTRFAAFAERLGRNSLPVFVFHVWVVQVLVRLTGGYQITGLGRLALAAAGLGALWAFAYLLEIGEPKRAKRRTAPEPLPAVPHPTRALLFRPVGGMMSLTIATLTIVAVANLEQKQLAKWYTSKRHHAPMATQPYASDDGHAHQRAPWDGGPLPGDDATPNWVEDPDDEEPDAEETDGTADPAAAAFGGPVLETVERVPQGDGAGT